MPLRSRQRVGALRDGSQQVSDPRVGIPDDEAQLIGGGRHRARATAPLHPAQSRLPEAAQSPGHHVTGREAEAETGGRRNPDSTLQNPLIQIFYTIKQLISDL